MAVARNNFGIPTSSGEGVDPTLIGASYRPEGDALLKISASANGTTFIGSPTAGANGEVTALSVLSRSFGRRNAEDSFAQRSW
jgi:hypothetical protein